ncbi:tRNA dihydrouridine(20/20a) synthase DusA [Simiduia agarivorans]|uniref:tRNA-dihydrouridine(20/20a) synthase n=1 Tax=Simiduia agarivorans (strain DSM 21679 / JCM 13881 / BCRC 17597 / SA1) TaxID=1117647 RepID=K4KRQ4_SIMAS|nr:tRNA dihydrouridine(20/20a) synthase DusA [Simiduia agarivorans]AFV00834.1 tRNA-dihydrouridine synthase A [Simiduia agarivorans SA1 = DSM 21679]
MPISPRAFSLAPMMEWSDRHCRYFWRLLSKQAFLYTEMVTTGALIHGDRERFLNYNPEEHPVALQLGGSNPQELAACAQMAESWGYDEVNLNCGCPSDRVQNGMIGACLMAQPQLVADCIKAMQDAVQIPVTVKHRIGIDDMDDDQGLLDFVAPIAATGCVTFIVHARKAWLKGLSPKENREIPPLNYDRVHKLKQEFPDLEIIINGGLKTLADCQAQLAHVDGVMVGREAYHNPWLLSEVDAAIYGQPPVTIDRLAVIDQMMGYIDKQLSAGMRLHHITRHLLGLFHGQPGGKQFRRIISAEAHKPGADAELVYRALEPIRSRL